MQHISLYLDNAKVGCGWRNYLVIRIGRKHAELISTETADRIKVDARTLAQGRALPLKRTRAARRLRAVAKTYGKEDSRPVRDALRMLRST